MFKISLRIHPVAFPIAGWTINAPQKGKSFVVSVAEVHTNWEGFLFCKGRSHVCHLTLKLSKCCRCDAMSSRILVKLPYTLQRRDVKIKNKSPVSWSFFPPGSWRLPSTCSLQTNHSWKKSGIFEFEFECWQDFVFRIFVFLCNVFVFVIAFVFVFVFAMYLCLYLFCFIWKVSWQI